MNSRLTRACCALLAAPAFAPLLTAEPWTFALAPAWLESKDTDEGSLAARFELGSRHTFYRGNFDGSIDTSLNGTLMRRAAENPENLNAGVDGVAMWLFEQDLGAPPSPGTAAAPSEIKWPSLLLRLHGTIRLESDQEFANTQMAIGPRVSFASVNNTGWWWMIPSLHLGYHRIEVFESRQLRMLGEPEQSHYRFDAHGSWQWKPFAALTRHPALTRIGLHADLRYYRAYDMPEGAGRASLDDAFYRAFDLSYDLTDRNWKHVREIYLRFARGRLPAATSDSQTISVGIVLVP